MCWVVSWFWWGFFLVAFFLFVLLVGWVCCCGGFCFYFVTMYEFSCNRENKDFLSGPELKTRHFAQIEKMSLFLTYFYLPLAKEVSGEILLSVQSANGLCPKSPEVSREMLMLFIWYWIKSYCHLWPRLFSQFWPLSGNTDLNVDLYLLKYFKSVNKW